MTMTVPKGVEEILKRFAISRGGELSIKFCEQDRRDAGFMGDIHYITINEKDEPLDLVVKTAPVEGSVRENYKINTIYLNEQHFYETLWPMLKDFQFQTHNSVDYSLVPKCYMTDSNKGDEKIVLQNLRSRGFENMEKRDVFTMDQIEHVLSQYGRFHGLTMVYKLKNDKLFMDTFGACYDYFADIKSYPIVCGTIKVAMEKVLAFLKEENETDIIKKFEPYCVDPVGMLVHKAEYKGKHKVLNHGDSWSDNVMFRYGRTSGKRIVVEAKFIDFQLTRVSTPIHDISLCLFSCGSQEIYDNLRALLKLYYKNLSDTLLKFKCNPENVYSSETFKAEWKEFCLFGMIMGLQTMTIKLTEKLNLKEMLEDIQQFRTKIDDAEFKARALALLRHLHKSDLL